MAGNLSDTLDEDAARADIEGGLLGQAAAALGRGTLQAGLETARAGVSGAFAGISTGLAYSDQYSKAIDSGYSPDVAAAQARAAAFNAAIANLAAYGAAGQCHESGEQFIDGVQQLADAEVRLSDHDRARAQRRPHRRNPRPAEPGDERHGRDQDGQPANHRLRALAPYADDVRSVA